MKQEIYIDLHYILYYVSISINTQILSRALEKSGKLFAGFSSKETPTFSKTELQIELRIWVLCLFKERLRDRPSL